MELIAQGAEGKLMLDGNTVIKERFSKRYRLPQLDQSLRQFRTRREAKVLQRLEEIHFPAPHLREFCDKRMSIFMDFIPGEKLKDVLEKGDDYQLLAEEMGTKIGRLHQENIIHGDLTTSNILVNNNNNNNNETNNSNNTILAHNGAKHNSEEKLSLIDFGLSFFSEKVEDKAVDLFLLDRALQSTHYQLYPQIFDFALEGYKQTYPEAETVLKRFEQVKSRGRNKNKS